MFKWFQRNSTFSRTKENTTTRYLHSTKEEGETNFKNTYLVLQNEPCASNTGKGCDLYTERAVLRETTTPQTIGFNNEQKQSLYTCVLHFGTFLCRPLQNNNVKRPHFRFCGERERITVNFSFSFLTCTPLLPIWFLDSSPFCKS